MIKKESKSLIFITCIQSQMAKQVNLLIVIEKYKYSAFSESIIYEPALNINLGHPKKKKKYLGTAC